MKKLLPALLIASILIGCGMSDQERDAKRDQDRTAMRLGDVQRERDQYKMQLDQLQSQNHDLQMQVKMLTDKLSQPSAPPTTMGR